MAIGMSAGDLFDLAGKISVDTSNLDKGMTSAQRQVIALADSFKKTELASQASFAKVGTAAKSVEQKLIGASHGANAMHHEFLRASVSGEGLHAQLVSLASGSSLLSSPALLVTGIVAGLGISAFEAGKGLFELAKSAAEYGDSIDDAHEKTSLSVATLSALKVAGREAGISLESMTGGLVRFTRNLEEAASGNKKLTNEFKQLQVTAFHDSDVALKQFLTSFARLKTDQERTLAATEVFGARFGANLVETFGKVGGNLPAFEAKLRSMGLILSEDDAKAADEFEKSLADLNMRMEGISRTMGQQMIPAFQAGFVVMDAAMNANRQNWKEWGEDIAKVILTVESLLGGYANMLKNADWTNLIPVYGQGKALKDFYDGLISTADKVTEAYNKILHPPVGVGASIGTGGSRFHIPGDEKESKGTDPASTAKRLAEISLQIQLDNFKAAEDGFKRSLARRTIDFEQYVAEINVVEADRHRNVISGLTAETKAAEQLRNVAQKQVALKEIERKNNQETIRHKEALAKTEDEQAKFTERVNDFIKDQDRAIRDAHVATSQWTQSIDDLIDSLAKQGVTLDPAIEKTLRFKAAIQNTEEWTRRLLEALDSVTTSAANLPEVLGVSDVNGPSAERVNRRMGGALPPMMITPEQLDRVRRLAADLTNVLDRSISEGFSRGIKAGLVSFAQGILDMIRSAALDALEKRLADVFSKALSGNDGSIWMKLLNLGSNAAMAFAGGGSGSTVASGSGGVGGHAGIHFSTGGIVPGIDRGYDSVPAMLRPGERVIPRGQAGGGNTFIVNINVPDIQSAGSRATQYQVARQMQSHLEKVSLAG